MLVKSYHKIEKKYVWFDGVIWNETNKIVNTYRFYSHIHVYYIVLHKYSFFFVLLLQSFNLSPYSPNLTSISIIIIIIFIIQSFIFFFTLYEHTPIALKPYLRAKTHADLYIYNLNAYYKYIPFTNYLFVQLRLPSYYISIYSIYQLRLKG